jgi:hypothetical protein
MCIDIRIWVTVVNKIIKIPCIAKCLEYRDCKVDDAGGVAL